MATLKSRTIAIAVILLSEVVLVSLFSVFVKYDGVASPKGFANDTLLDSQYPLFQDIHVMIFIGFGFLMTFLKKYAFSALGFTFLVASIVIQWGLLCQGFFNFKPGHKEIDLNINSLMNADILAAAILISLGAVLGKISPIQLLVMAILETALFAANEHLGVEVIEAVDCGGSIFVHAFGAYFGLAVSFVLGQFRRINPENEENKLESSSYESDIHSMIGTLFLWVFWPSFNAGLLTGDERHRAIINTYLALTASCVMTFAVSALCSKDIKFEMMHVQNATLAGGVCIGTSANMMVHPYGALMIGCYAGVLSTLGYKFIQGYLAKYLRVHDTCGVNNLHGMPGLSAGLISAIITAMADEDTYGKGLLSVFPPMGGSKNRSAGVQAGYQVLALVATFFLSVAGGLLTGVLLSVLPPKVSRQDAYKDQLWWESEENLQEA